MSSPHNRQTGLKAECQHQNTQEAACCQRFSLPPHARQVRHGNRQGAQGDEQESHALSLRHAQGQEEVAEQRERPDAARSAFRTGVQAGREGRSARIDGRSVKTIGLDRERHDGKKQAQRARRQRSFGWVEDFVEARPAENAPEERKHGIAGMKVGSQVPAAANGNRGRDVGKCEAWPAGRATLAIDGLRSSIAARSRPTSKPHKTSAGYLTPAARPAKQARGDRRAIARLVVQAASRRRSPPSRTQPGPRH